METRIGRWQNRFAAYGDVERAAVLARTLESSREVLDAFHCGLAEVFSEEETVYVLRSVTFDRFMLVERTGGAPAQRLGRRLAAGVARAILKDSGDGQNLVRFENGGEFAARFIHDLLHDRAWGRWYYGAFARFRAASTRDTVRGVLAANAKELARLMGYLARLGSLERVLELVDGPALRELLAAVLPPRSRVDAAVAFRPLFAAAFAIASRLGWVVDRGSYDAVLERFTATALVAADWHDRASLTAGVLRALQFLLEHGPRQASRPVALSTVADIRADFDWLDWAQLQDGLARLSRQSAGSPVAPAEIQRGAAPTAARLDFAGALVAAIRRSGADFLGEPARDVLRVLAALEIHDPRWSGAEHTLELIAQLCTIAECAGRAGTTSIVRQALDPTAPVPRLDAPSVEDVRRFEDAVRGARRLSTFRFELGAALEARLAAVASVAPVTRVETRCAGLFLLVRPLLDVRLTHLLAEAGYPAAGDARQVGWFLAALGAAWAGPSSVINERLDPGLALWAGFDASPAASEVEAAWAAAADHRRFQSALSRALAGLRFLDVGTEAEVMRQAESTPELRPPFELGVDARLTVTMAAALLLRLWARWLRRFANASLPYLLDNLIRRPGELSIAADCVSVELEPSGLDIVLEMSGYLEPSPAIPWLGRRSVRLRGARS